MIMCNNLLYSSCKAKRLERRNFFSFRNAGAFIDVVDIYQEYNRGTYRNMQFYLVFFLSVPEGLR